MPKIKTKRSARRSDVLTAITEGRLRVDLDKGEFWYRRPWPKAVWRKSKPAVVTSPGRKQRYLSISFSTSQGWFCCLAHRVVWWASGEQEVPDNMTIDHLDFNPENNRRDNLEMVSYAENNRRARAANRYDPFAPKNWSITARRVRAIRRHVANGESQSDVARRLDVSVNVVNRIVLSRTYRSVT